MGNTVGMQCRVSHFRSWAQLFSLAAFFLLFAGGAEAQTGPCTTAGYSTTYSQCSGNTVRSSSTVTSSETVRIAVAQTGGLIASRIGALSGGPGGPGFARAPDQHVKILALGNAGQEFETTDPEVKKLEEAFGVKGVSAGATKPKLGIWADGAWSRVLFTKSDSKFDGEIWSGVAGVDYAFTDRLIAGVAMAYEKQDFDTTFNRGSVDGSGYTAAPYVVFKLHKNFSIDASGGYSWLDYENTRKDPITGAGITGTTDASRWFGATNLNAGYILDKWRFGGKIGTLYAREKKDAFTESNGVRVGEQTTSIGDVQLGIRLGYMFNVLDGLEPFVSALGRYAYQDGGSGDKTDAVLGVGTNLRAGPANLSVQGTTVEGRDNTKIYSGSINLRIEF